MKELRVNLTIALLNNFAFILIIHYHKQVLEKNYITDTDRYRDV